MLQRSWVVCPLLGEVLAYLVPVPRVFSTTYLGFSRLATVLLQISQEWYPDTSIFDIPRSCPHRQSLPGDQRPCYANKANSHAT